MNISTTDLFKIAILPLSVLFLLQGFNSASASPVFSAPPIYDPGVVNVPEDGHPDGRMYLDITKVIYSSDGKFLHATFILSDTFDNTTSQSMSYGMLINADDNFQTGIGGYDYRYEVTWKNHTWIETYEHLIDNEVEPVIVYSGELHGIFTHGEKFINLSLDLSKIASPEHYSIIFFSDGKNVDGSPIEDFTSLAIIPPPNFIVTTIPNPIILKPGAHTVGFIQIQSEMQGHTEIFFNVNLPQNDTVSIKSLLPSNSFFLSNGIAEIPIDIAIPSNSPPSYHTVSVLLTPFYPVNPNRNNPDIKDQLIQNAYYRNQDLSEPLDTGIAVSSADPLPIEFWVQVCLVIATIGIVIATITSMIITSRQTQRQLRLAEQANNNARQANDNTIAQLALASKEFSLKKREIESTLKSELILDEDLFTDIQQENLGNGKMSYTGEFEAKLHNTGSLTAENIRVFHSDPLKSNNLNEIVKDADNIKKKLIRIRGNILKNGTEQISKIKIPLDNKDPFTLAIWVMYDDSEALDREFIYVFNIKGTRNCEKFGPYSKSQIERARSNTQN